MFAASPYWPMIVTPSAGLVLGGYEVSVSSICLTSTDTVTCRFGSEDGTDIIPVTMDDYSATCIAPLLTQTGNVPVYVAVGSGDTVQVFPGQIYVGMFKIHYRFEFSMNGSH